MDRFTENGCLHSWKISGFSLQIELIVLWLHIEYVNKIFHALGFCDRASWANCEVREKTNKMQQSDVYYQLLSQHVSGIIMPIFRRTKTVCYCVWYCWMWLVAVVGRCVVGCKHCEGYCSNSNLHSARILQRSAPHLLPTTSTRTSAAHRMQ